MADAPNLQIHARLKTPSLRARLDAYCEQEQRTIAAAINVLLDQALAAYEANRETKALAARDRRATR